ncbi:MAG: polymer-forming cytoskeletal protein [Bacteroidales bacterium]|nr:polymer-forming cytoskeletal protein [Bacteroidales bacterium]
MAREMETSNAVNLISTGTRFTGDVFSSSGFRIDGTLVGKMNIKGKVVVGSSGRIEGDVFCQTIEISGTILGNIQVAEMASLKSSSRVKGEIITRKLAIEPGAIFTGTCKMDEDLDAKQKETPPKK